MENSTYKTKDLGEAAALLVKKQKLVRMDREGRTCWFIFAENTLCLELSGNYFFGELPANLRDYYEALNILKNRIFST